MYNSGGASLLLFERDKSDREQRWNEEKQYRKETGQSFVLPEYTKGLPFATLVVFQFVLSMSYLTPIYFMERKWHTVVYAFWKNIIVYVASLTITEMPILLHTTSLQHAYRDLEADGGGDQRLVQRRVIRGEDCYRPLGRFGGSRCAPSGLLLVKHTGDLSPMDILKVVSGLPLLRHRLWHHLLGNHHGDPGHCREPVWLVYPFFYIFSPCTNSRRLR